MRNGWECKVEIREDGMSEDNRLDFFWLNKPKIETRAPKRIDWGGILGAILVGTSCLLTAYFVAWAFAGMPH